MRRVSLAFGRHIEVEFVVARFHFAVQFGLRVEAGSDNWRVSYYLWRYPDPDGVRPDHRTSLTALVCKLIVPAGIGAPAGRTLRTIRLKLHIRIGERLAIELNPAVNRRYLWPAFAAAGYRD